MVGALKKRTISEFNLANLLTRRLQLLPIGVAEFNVEEILVLIRTGRSTLFT